MAQHSGKVAFYMPGQAIMRQRSIIHYILAVPLRKWLAKMSTSASAKLHIASQAHPLYACWAIPLKRRLANPYDTLVGQELLARYLRPCVNYGWPVLSIKIWLIHVSFDTLPDRKPWDHAIELEFRAKASSTKVYPLSYSKDVWSGIMN